MGVGGALANLEVVLTLRDDMSKNLGTAASSAESQLGRISKMTTVMAGLQVGALVASAAQAVTAPVVDFFTSAITSSSNASEEISKFAAVFKDQAGKGEEWVTASAAAMGRSEGMMRSMAATFGAVLTPQMDGNTEAALELSEGYAELAVDLASFMNVSEEDAAKAISSAIAGETEPMRKYGVMLNEAAINAELMAMGLNKTQKEASAAELQQARYNIIMKATADAQGDAVRTADGYANSMRALGARTEQMMTDIGTAIMPIAMSLVHIAGGAVEKFGAIWKNLVPMITPVIAQIAAAITTFGTMASGALDSVIAGFGSMLPKVIGVLGSVAGAVVSFVAPIVTALRDTLGPIVGEAARFFTEQFQKVADWWARDGAGIVQAVSGFASALSGTLATAITVVGGIIRTYLMPAFEWLAGGILDIILDGISAISGWFNSSGVQKAIKDLAQGFTDWCTAMQPVADAVIGIGTAIASFLGPALGGIWEAFKGFAAFLGGVLYSALMVIWDTLSAVAGWVATTFGPVWAALQVVITGAWAAICALFAPGGPTDLVAILGGIWTAISTYAPIAWRIIQEAVITAAGLIWTWLSTEGVRLGGEAVAAIWAFISAAVPAAWTVITNAVITAAGLIWTWLSTEGLRLGGEAVMAIWNWLTANVPVGWGIIQNAVITAAGLIWTWLSTEGLRLAGVAVGLIWTFIKEAVPAAWDLIQTAVITAAGLIWSWLTGTGKDQGNSAVNVIWTAIKDAVPGAWNLIQTAVITAAGLIWSWMKTTAPGLAVAAIAAAWSAIAGAVPGAWEAIKSAVATAAQNVWDEAQRILKKAFAFELPDIVGAARRAYDAAQRALKGDDSAGPAVAPTAAPGIDIDNPVAVAPSGTGGRWVDGHYISPGANGYWDHGTWVPVHHSGGIYEAPGGASEGYAYLQSGERVLSRSQTQSFDRLLRALETGAGHANGGVTIEHVTLSQDYPYDRLLRDIRREIAMTRSARGILS